MPGSESAAINMPQNQLGFICVLFMRASRLTPELTHAGPKTVVLEAELPVHRSLGVGGKAPSGIVCSDFVRCQSLSFLKTTLSFSVTTILEADTTRTLCMTPCS